MKLIKTFSTAVAATALLFSSVASAALITDVMWVIDTSGSMGDDINEVKSRIVDFNTAMINAGIDARYGLVRFGGSSSLIQDITTFTTFNQAGGPFATLAADGGGFEDGSDAMQTALAATWRANTIRNIILVTDEDDDDSSNRAAFDLALASTSANEFVNIIGNPFNDSDNYYANLAPANHGTFFDITDFRSDPDTFFTNFINVKVAEVLDFCEANPTAPDCLGSAPEPGSLFLLGLGLAGFGSTQIRRRRA
jgi:hypothetical protein